MSDVAAYLPGGDAPATSQRIVEVVKFLIAEPILQQPCVEWCKVQVGLIAQAKLMILFGKDRAEAMMDAERKKEQQT